MDVLCAAELCRYVTHIDHPAGERITGICEPRASAPARPRHENWSDRVPLDQDRELHGTLPVGLAPRMGDRLVAVRRAQLSRFHILGVKKRSASMELLKGQLRLSDC
jgi:hypothetical protein